MSCVHYKGQIEAKNLHVIWDSAENTTTRCDEKLIMMVLDNFISNAVRFCKENGVIRFTIAPGTVNVYNEGAQIPEDQIKEIWTPMYKGSADKAEKTASCKAFGGWTSGNGTGDQCSDPKIPSCILWGS